MATDERRRLFLPMVSIIFLANQHGCSSSRTGSQAECEEARFVPQYNLAGEGFDVVYMERKSAYVIDVKTFMTENHTCTLYENSLQKGQVQKVPVSIVDWRSHNYCDKQFSSKLHHSVDSLVHESTSSIRNNWRADIDLDTMGHAVLGGSRSKMAQFGRIQLSMDKATFIVHDITCTRYSYRLADHKLLSKEFSQHLKGLPKQYNDTTKDSYHNTIKKYGTHYINKVWLGGRIQQVSAFRTCIATLNGISESDIQDCLLEKFKVHLEFIPANAHFDQKCRDIFTNHMTAVSYQGLMNEKKQIIGGNYLTFDSWVSSLNDTPDITSYEISALHDLVSDSTIKNNMKKAMEEYILKNEFYFAQKSYQRCLLSPNLDSNCCPKRAGRGMLTVTVLRASDLNSDYFSETDAYVKVMYDDKYEQTNYVLNNNNPIWNRALYLGLVELDHMLTLEVWDADVRYDDLIGRCRIYPKQGRYSHICPLDQGVLYFSYHVICDAHLTGNKCQIYSPSENT